MKIIAISVLFVALAGTAAASAGSVQPWTRHNMTAAVRAVGYPKPHPRKLSCRKAGAGFNCVAVYRRKRRFYIQGAALGGWLCAGTRPSTCRILRHGFAAGPTSGDPHGAADLAAQGYMGWKYNDPVPVVKAPCVTTGQLVWTCQYAGESAPVTVTVRLKVAKGGWVVTAAG